MYASESLEEATSYRPVGSETEEFKGPILSPPNTSGLFSNHIADANISKHNVTVSTRAIL